jgi:signal transduction histidine kinase
VLLSYLKRHAKIILMLCLFTAVFAAVFSLYDLPAEAVLYAALLCLCVGAALFGVGYARWLRHHRMLSSLAERAAGLPDELPVPSGALEEDYQDIIRGLWSEKARAEARFEAERRDMADYYGLWAHQIKTPIAAMRLLLQQEESRRNAEPALELFKIEQYVEMVLSYVRLESESTDLVLRKCDLDELIREALRKYARMFILKKIALDFTGTGKTVLTDEKWLSFVLEQLISNALKYTPEGSVRLYAEGDELIIEDTGIGIRAEDLPRVFEKGFTGYNGREDKKSTGIGLFLCRRVCDRLGHRLSIESAVGRGTTVRVDLSAADTLLE